MSGTVLVTGDYTVGPGQNISASDPWTGSQPLAGVLIDPTNPSEALDFELDATVSVTDNAAPNSSVYGILDETGVSGSGPVSASSLARVGVNGTINVTTTSNPETGLITAAVGYDSQKGFVSFENDGTITVVSLGTASLSSGTAQAVGVEMAVDFVTSASHAGGSVLNKGLIDVTGVFGDGVELGDGATLDNVGTIAAHGGAVAVSASNGSAIVNSGQITAYPPSSGGGAAIVGGEYSLINSGVITGFFAVQTDGGILNVTNTGTINGTVQALPVTGVAAGSFSGSQVHNSGAINGNVVLADNGDDLYDGRGGTLSGTLVLGNGHTTVLLGDDGESVGTFNESGTGSMTLLGGAGADVVRGGTGNDFIDGGAGNDNLDGGGGVNTAVFASAPSGVTVSLALQGSAQDTGDGVKTLNNFQNLTGSAFNDHLIGDANDNVLDGGGGNDVLTGGGGADTFVFHPGYGADEITDFSDASGDKIDLSSFPTLHSLADVLASAVQSGPNTVISLPSGTSITLDNTTASSLQAGDFILSPLTPADHLNYGGSSDILFRDPATGDWGFMSANAGGGETWHSIGPASTDYVPMGAGDFTGAGVVDMAFRDTSTGDWGYMSINPTGGETWHPIAGGASLAFDAIATGNFDGNGSTDILFRDPTTGDWGYMAVNAGGGESWHPIGSSSPDYAFIGVGDFNGDGVLDAAFRQSSTGDWGFLTINPGGGETWHQVAGGASLAYDAIGVGNFAGNGSSDILFRDAVTGDWGYMSVNANGSESWHDIGASSPAYAFIGVGDFNGDGAPDAAFRDISTGDWGYMSINPGGGETWHYVGPSSTAYLAV